MVSSGPVIFHNHFGIKLLRVVMGKVLMHFSFEKSYEKYSGDKYYHKMVKGFFLVGVAAQF